MSSPGKNFIIDKTAESLGDVGNSTFIANYGFIIGTTINIIWIIIGVILIKEKNHIDWFKSCDWYTHVPSIVLLATAIGNMGYYYYSKENDKDKNTVKDKSEKNTYIERKKLGIIKSIEYLNLPNFNEWETFFKNHSKKDDLADSFLQGLWYITNKML